MTLGIYALRMPSGHVSLGPIASPLSWHTDCANLAHLAHDSAIQDAR